LFLAKKFEKIVLSMPQVVECEAVLGDVDYLLKVLSRGVDDYLEIIEHMEAQIEMDYKTLSVSKIVKTPSQVNVEEIYNYYTSD